MGTVTVREFALVAAVANVDEAPPEMLATALTRARMCQQLARRIPAADPEESFTVGLFSVAEAVADAPIGEVVGELPLREDVAAALVGGAGELGRLLGVALAYERGDFASAGTLRLEAKVLAETYLEALRWADSAVKAVG
jgi:EAL and modified HD-GYP domain-containing signal transduction protein